MREGKVSSMENKDIQNMTRPKNKNAIDETITKLKIQNQLFNH